MLGRAFYGALLLALSAGLVVCGGPYVVPTPPVTPATVPRDSATATAVSVTDAGATVAAVPVDPAWAPIDKAIEAAIAESKLPGCVVIVGRHDDILFEKAYGSRAVLPERIPMTTETVFDLASLTKPVATATSVMILVDRGKINLDARASLYVPELARLPPFTVRQLLVHTSGLPSVTPMSHWSTSRADVIGHIAHIQFKAVPGERFNYSDVGFVVLQEIVQRVAGKSLDAFAAEEIFAPLGMKDTSFLPAPELRARAAPTEERDGGFIIGEVHDPRAFAAGGVSGHAGVFSTAYDMSRFARAMLEHGTFENHRLFGDKTFERFVARQVTSKGGRALGWDLDSVFATNRSPLFSQNAFGHGGYTGTAMWIDPKRDLFVVFLSNRVHPDGKGAVNPLIAEVATLAVGASETKTGIDILRAESFARLRGHRIGLITNAATKAKDGTTTLDAIRGAEGVSLRAIFTPEHGIGGEREGKIADSKYQGIPVHSLYGERFAPTSDTLDDIDTLVFDLQDVGMRFYTYASTMKRAMKTAAERHLRFVVLDRPNPLGGLDVEGPVLADSDVQGFVNHHALPLRHGMTMGELARLFVEDDKLDLDLDIVKMVGWRRKDTFERTGLTWAAPSPNLRSLRSVALYPAIGLLESTNLTVGRGTETPFEVFAAPWMDGPLVTKKLTEANIPGVTFEATKVTPKSAIHANKLCRGVRVRLTDPQRFDPIRTALVIASTLHEVHPKEWTFDDMDKMLRFPPALDAIRDAKGPADIEATWAEALGRFKERRTKFLLYP